MGKHIVKIAFGCMTTCIFAVLLVPMWKWHVCPLGVPPLRFWQAFGLYCLIGMLPTKLGAFSNAELMAADDIKAFYKTKSKETGVNETMGEIIVWISQCVAASLAYLMAFGLAYFAHVMNHQ